MAKSPVGDKPPIGDKPLIGDNPLDAVTRPRGRTPAAGKAVRSEAATSKTAAGPGSAGKGSAGKGSGGKGSAGLRLPPRVSCTFERELALYQRGLAPVAGADEAGRGPLAGPVVAAAVILDPARIPAGLDDSKKLTAARREELFAEICATAQIGLSLAPPARIDRDNIRQATLWALARAVKALPVRPALVFVDGNDPPKAPCDVEMVIGGDALIASIAAASIVAKVARDRLMCGLGLHFPAYGFERHMGYATAEHGAALIAHGPCPHHRRSFAPVREQQLALFGGAGGQKRPGAASPRDDVAEPIAPTEETATRPLVVV